MTATKQTIIDSLRRFARQRPGLEFGNYGDAAAYRSELRSITRDLAHAQTLLHALEWRSGITADGILAAARDAFSGRLTIDSESGQIDYCTGQYWPTEYRRAVCAVASAALWAYFRDHAMPEPTAYAVTCLTEERKRDAATSRTFSTRAEAGAYAVTVAPRHPSVDPLYRGASAGDFLRKLARDEFGRGIAARWFA